MKTKVAGHCQIYVKGLTMRCPLCSTVVQSGQMHECKKVEPTKPTKKRKR